MPRFMRGIHRRAQRSAQSDLFCDGKPARRREQSPTVNAEAYTELNAMAVRAYRRGGATLRMRLFSVSPI